MSNPTHKIVEEVKYGLWHKKEKCMLKVSTTSNDGADFCTDISHSLTTYGDQVWYAHDIFAAEYVRNFSTEWYNANYETPNHNFEPDELAIVKVKIRTEFCPEEFMVPTMKEFLAIKFKESDPGHYKYCMEQLKKYPGHNQKYSLYELEELIEKGKWPKGK